MPADPASKGLIENVVKYVKGNFLAGRTYVNISVLNEEALEMKKANKELLRLALEEYREACYRMQAESERCREIEAGEYDESKQPDPEAWCYWISAMDGLETTVESVLFDE